MYKCISSQKMGFFLVLAALLLTLCLTVSRVGKALAAQEVPPSGVFLPVIMYHSLTEPTNDYQLSPADFAQDLAYLKSHGYESVTITQLTDYTHGKGELPAHPVLITFDDGFYNNLSAALPLLEQYDMQAVVSVVGRYTDELAPADPHVERYSYLTWEDIRTLLDSGRVELGSHTYDMHTNNKRAGCSILLGEDVDAYTLMLRTDLETLQNRAKTETGASPAVFAYPYGFICRESIPVLKDLGFVCTLTCREEPNYITRDPACLYALGRYHRSPRYSTEEFFAKALNP
ncbi:MAG: polysaccharide deacetylase family protein [Oscillospiraceae bacterium]|nr:polysaccharide deacetylase family protein [Oscillospiraceae bacterium]